MVVGRGRFRGRIEGGQKRRETLWSAGADTAVFQSLAAGASVLDQAFSDAQLQTIGLPLTVVRVRGLLYIVADQPSAVEDQFGALGFQVVTEQARVAGIASMPTPITEAESDTWFVWEPFCTSGLASTNSNIAGARFDFDSKAMRKIEQGSAIVVVLENGSSIHGLEFWLQYRILFKLH